MFEFLMAVSEDPRRLGCGAKTYYISKELNAFVFGVKQSDPSKVMNHLSLNTRVFK